MIVLIVKLPEFSKLMWYLLFQTLEILFAIFNWELCVRLIKSEEYPGQLQHSNLKTVQEQNWGLWGESTFRMSFLCEPPSRAKSLRLALVWSQHQLLCTKHKTQESKFHVCLPYVLYWRLKHWNQSSEIWGSNQRGHRRPRGHNQNRASHLKRQCEKHTTTHGTRFQQQKLTGQEHSK